MSRTGLTAQDLAKSLRTQCGDGSMEWVTEPMQTSVLLDIADMLDERVMLCNGYGSMSREHSQTIVELSDAYYRIDQLQAENAKLREVVLALADCRNTTCDDCVRWDYPDGGCSLDGVLRELRVEVDQ